MWRLYFQIQYITLKSQRLKLAKSELRGKKNQQLKKCENLFLKNLPIIEKSGNCGLICGGLQRLPWCGYLRFLRGSHFVSIMCH